MAGAFRDFIPEGENPGAQGSGFRDFVPAPKPVYHEETPEIKPETPVVEEIKKEIPKKKGK